MTVQYLHYHCHEKLFRNKRNDYIETVQLMYYIFRLENFCTIID